jgi:hypothetical protein
MSTKSITTLFSLLIFSLTNLTGSVIDFGERGNTQEITEPSLKAKLSEALHDFNATKKKEEFKSSIHAVGDAVLHLPGCDRNTTRKVIPQTTLTKDYYTPDGRVIAKKGTNINPISKFKGTKQPKIVIFDANSTEQIKYVKSICKEGGCILGLNQGNSFTLNDAYDLQAYPLPKMLTDILTARCSLSVYEIDGEQYRISEFRMEGSK